MTQDTGSTNKGKIFNATLTLPAGSNVVTIVATDLGANGGNKTTNNYAVNVVGGPDKTFGYDLNGNMTNDSGGISYEYDAENRTVAINRGMTNRTELVYDGFGRKVQIIEKQGGTAVSTNKYVWCGLQLCEERDSSGANVTKRFFAEGEQINGTNYFFTRDHLGSIREMTDSSGAIQVRYDYNPYGVRTFEPYTPTIARGVPGNLTLAQLLGYERFSKRSKAHLHQTEQPNALPTSWRCPG